MQKNIYEDQRRADVLMRRERVPVMQEKRYGLCNMVNQTLGAALI